MTNPDAGHGTAEPVAVLDRDDLSAALLRIKRSVDGVTEGLYPSTCRHRPAPRRR